MPAQAFPSYLPGRLPDSQTILSFCRPPAQVSSLALLSHFTAVIRRIDRLHTIAKVYLGALCTFPLSYLATETTCVHLCFRIAFPWTAPVLVLLPLSFASSPLCRLLLYTVCVPFWRLFLASLTLSLPVCLCVSPFGAPCICLSIWSVVRQWARILPSFCVVACHPGQHFPVCSPSTDRPCSRIGLLLCLLVQHFVALGRGDRWRDSKYSQI